ncbi:Basic-leucine zipper (bZIP) transcription factor family protein [Forsythia ovata]|uniref:Basic-leucine zipper (BZIP) transcription factor family protein n=1 Tax=Forsythia ovata TaxID=205694 RepID=A0ABD1QQ09_9LAMI
MMYNGKNPLLPPKSPFPGIYPSYVDYIPNSGVGPKGLPKPREANSHHQRTSSESFLLEEQPSWFDELLNEPETPVRRGGHRRSSSDSFAYIDSANVGNTNYVAPDNNKFKNLTAVPSWGSQDFEFYRDIQHGSSYGGPYSSGKTKNRTWDIPVNSVAPPRGLPSPRDNTMSQNAVLSSTSRELERNPSSPTEKQDPSEYGPHDPKSSSEKDTFHAKPSTPEMDTKRAKQQFAQRSRVRKLQYIAELERNLLALQAEGSEVSAELEFLNQQNLILNMENKTLKQRLESLAQEHLIKHFEHEVLEREVGRLQALYQQQQQPQQQQPSSSHRRAKSSDLDQQFVNLSLKHKESSAGRNQFPLCGIKPDSSSTCALPLPALLILLPAFIFFLLVLFRPFSLFKIVSPCAPGSLCQKIVVLAGDSPEVVLQT